MPIILSSKCSRRARSRANGSRDLADAPFLLDLGIPFSLVSLCNVNFPRRPDCWRRARCHASISSPRAATRLSMVPPRLLKHTNRKMFPKTCAATPRSTTCKVSIATALIVSPTNTRNNNGMAADLIRWSCSQAAWLRLVLRHPALGPQLCQSKCAMVLDAAHIQQLFIA